MAMDERGPSPEATARHFARLLDRFEAAGEARMTTAVSEEELQRLEHAIGDRLPAELRALLRSIGAGIYEHGHEIFGPMRVMIHDIELVPDMLTMRGRLAADAPLEPHAVPFHRGQGVVHFILTAGPRTGEVVSLPAGRSYPDLPTFLERVMMGSDPAAS